MGRYSIAGKLPVNVIIEARNKKEATKKAKEAAQVEYEPAGDIEINEKYIVRI
jgi:hypothetical protein